MVAVSCHVSPSRVVSRSAQRPLRRLHYAPSAHRNPVPQAGHSASAPHHRACLYRHPLRDTAPPRWAGAGHDRRTPSCILGKSDLYTADRPAGRKHCVVANLVEALKRDNCGTPSPGRQCAECAQAKDDELHRPIRQHSALPLGGPFRGATSRRCERTTISSRSKSQENAREIVMITTYYYPSSRCASKTPGVTPFILIRSAWSSSL